RHASSQRSEMAAVRPAGVVRHTGDIMRKLASVWIGLIAVFALIAAPSAAQATPITYQFTGTGSGILGATSFGAGTTFVVTLLGDTTDVAIKPDLGNAPGNENLTGTIAITGVGTATFTNTLFMFTVPGGGFYGFGTLLPLGHGNLITFNTLTGPDLVTNFGPITSTNTALSQFHDEATTLGNLTFRTMGDVT